MKTIKQYVRFAMPLIAGVAFLFASCSGIKDKEAQVPSNAIFVANMNVGSMWQKAGLNNPDNLQTYTLFRDGLGDAMPELETFLTNLLKDPTTTGIDTDKDLVLFAATKGNSIMTATAALEASLKSKEAFSDFLNKTGDLLGSKLTIEDGDLSYATLHTNVVMAFNNKSVVIVAGLQADSLKDYAKHLFELEGNEVMTSNEHYQAYLNDRQDEGFFLPFCNWFGEKGFMNDPTIKALMQQSGSQISDDQIAMLTKASCYVVTSFENGAIVSTGKNLGLDEEQKAILGNGIADNLMSFMPSNTLAAFSLSINMPALVKYIESDKNSMEECNKQLADAGISFTVSDLLNAFGGNLVASFYGIGKNNTPLFALAADITNAEPVNSFLAKAGIKGKNNVYTLDKDVILYFDGKTLALTDDAAATKAYAKGGFENPCAVVADKVRKGNYFFLDLKIADYPAAIHNLFGYVPGNNALLDQVLGLFDYLEFATVDATTSTCTLKLTDNSRNALATFVTTVDDAVMALLGSLNDDDLALDE